MAKINYSLLALADGEIIAKHIGEKGSTALTATGADTEALKVTLEESEYSLASHFLIKPEGAGAEFRVDLAQEELVSSLPLSKFSGESRIENILKVGDLSGAAAKATIDGSATPFIELVDSYKADLGEFKVYDVDFKAGSAAAQAANKSFETLYKSYSLDASESFVAGHANYRILLNAAQALIESDTSAKIQNTASSQGLKAEIAELRMDLAAGPYKVMAAAAKNNATPELYSITIPAIDANPAKATHKMNQDYIIDANVGGEIKWMRSGGATSDEILWMQPDGLTFAGEHISFERDPNGAPGFITSFTAQASDTRLSADGKFYINSEGAGADAQWFANLAAADEIRLRDKAAAVGADHIRLYSGGVQVGVAFEGKENVSLKKQITVDGDATFVSDVDMQANAQVGGNLTITGDLIANGSMVQIQGQQVNFEDTILRLGYAADTATANATLDVGFVMDYQEPGGGPQKQAAFYLDQSDGKFKFAKHSSELNGVLTIAAGDEAAAVAGIYEAMSLVKSPFIQSDLVVFPATAADYAAADAAMRKDAFKIGATFVCDDSGNGSITGRADDLSIQGQTAAGKLNFEQLAVSIGETTQHDWTWFDGQGMAKVALLELLPSLAKAKYRMDVDILDKALDLQEAGVSAAPVNLAPADIRLKTSKSILCGEHLEVLGDAYFNGTVVFDSADFGPIEADALVLESAEPFLQMQTPEHVSLADPNAAGTLDQFHVYSNEYAAANAGKDAEIWSSLQLKIEGADVTFTDAPLMHTGNATIGSLDSLGNGGSVVLSSNGKLTRIDGRVQIQQHAVVDDYLTVASYADIDGYLDVADEAKLAGAGIATTVRGNIVVAEASELQGDVSIGAPGSVKLSVQAASGDTNIHGTLTVAGITDLNSSLDVQGGINAQSILDVAGKAKFADNLWVFKDLLPGIEGDESSLQNLGLATAKWDAAWIRALNAESGDISGDLSVGGTSTLTGAAEIGDAGNASSLTVWGTSLLKLDVTANASVNVDVDVNVGQDLKVNVDKFIIQGASGDATGKGNLSIDGASTLKGHAEIGTGAAAANLRVYGNAEANGTLHVGPNGGSHTDSLQFDPATLIFSAPGATTVRGTFSVASDNTTLGANLQVFGISNLNGDVNIGNNPLGQQRALVVTGTQEISGTSALKGDVTVGENGAPATLTTWGDITAEANALVKMAFEVFGASTLKDNVVAEKELTVKLQSIFEGNGAASSPSNAGAAAFEVWSEAGFADKVVIDGKLELKSDLAIEAPSEIYIHKAADPANKVIELSSQDTYARIKCDEPAGYVQIDSEAGIALNSFAGMAQNPAAAIPAGSLVCMQASGPAPASAKNSASADYIIIGYSPTTIGLAGVCEAMFTSPIMGVQLKCLKDDISEAWAPGDIAYLSPAAGQEGRVTKDNPATAANFGEGTHIYRVGVCAKASLANSGDVVEIIWSAQYMHRK